MLSDLQVALLAAGAAFLIGIFAYNKLQERRLRRRVDAAMPPAPDALLEPAPVAPAGAAPVEGTAASAPVEHTLGLPPVEAPPAGAMAPESAGAGVLDPRLDYIATLTFASPRQGEEVLRTGMEMVRGAKLVNWEGFAPRLDAWRAIAPAAYYTQVRVGLQLVDRLGLATDEQIVDFCQAVQAFAATLVAEPVFAGRAQALRAAAELDAIAAQADIQVGFNVLKSDGPTIPAVRVHDLMTSAGLLLDADGRFRAVLPEGAELFSVGNMEATPFVEQAIPRTATRGVTMTLDVPRAPDDDATFREFTRFAHGAAKALDGQLVDDNRQPISTESLAGIGQAVAGAQAALREAGVPAGSPLALRLFSP